MQVINSAVISAPLAFSVALFTWALLALVDWRGFLRRRR